MSIKKKLYGALVGKNPPIRRAYVKYKSEGKPPVKRAIYLFRLNFSYYILRDKRLSKYNKSRSAPYCKGSESGLSLRETPEALAEKLSKYKAVSFDIFDTLIFRPFARPTDLFHIVGAEKGLLNFAETREYCERKAREKKFAKKKTREIDIDEIYDYIREYAGLSYASAKDSELEAEMKLCFANPYIKKVWDILTEKNVRIVVVSDMYLKRDFLEKLLQKNGFSGFEKLFVSNEYECSKYEGKLYEAVKQYVGTNEIAHVGDNPESDISKSLQHGFSPFAYRNINNFGCGFRSSDMSRVIGSAYGGVVNARLHNGLEKYHPLYEYGYLYSGIFVLGFCNFIRSIQLSQGADKVLFLARDGELLKKLYGKMYPEADTEYFLWSRLAATKLCFEENTLDFIRRFVYHKADGSLTGADILEQMELSELSQDCPMKNTLITDKNYNLLSEYILENRNAVREIYEPQKTGAKKYLSKMLEGGKKALAVDVGWAGSGGAAISLLSEEWKLDCEIIGVIAGTNDSFNEQPDASEALLQSGKLFSYCFSQSHNRDIYLTHDSAMGHNVFFEMLLGSSSPSLKGFEENGDPVFSENEKGNAEAVKLIHKGAEDFCEDYIKAFNEYPYMFNISGSDAYGPFLSAIRDGGKYFSSVLGECSFNVGVGTKEALIKTQL